MVIDMLDWALLTLRLCREMRDLSGQALRAFEEQNAGVVAVIKAQMQRVVSALGRDLPDNFLPSRIDDLRRHIAFSMVGDYHDILRHDLPNIEEKIDAYARRTAGTDHPIGFDELLHPIVREAAIRHY
ncbi:MAG: hypothetical protein EXQ99_03205 [Alphaproteobacteria bacterium]|nr:hypothetical protein [Alphaproteobacteria bacterium]